MLALLAVLLSAVAPSLRGFFRSRAAANATAQLAALMQWTRAQAITTGQVHRLNVASDGRCWVTVQEGGAFVDSSSYLAGQLSLPPGGTVRWEDGGEPSFEDVHAVAFYPTGRSDAVTITLVGRHGDVYRLECASVAEGYRVVKE